MTDMCIAAEGAVVMFTFLITIALFIRDSHSIPGFSAAVITSLNAGVFIFGIVEKLG